MLEPRLSCGPVLEWRLIGKPPPGVPPGELAHDGAILILGVIRALSDKRLVGKALLTFKKLLSLADADDLIHQLLMYAASEKVKFFFC